MFDAPRPAIRFVRIRVILLSVVLGVLTTCAGAQPSHGDPTPAPSVQEAAVAVTSLLGEFAADAAGVPGWVSSVASGRTPAHALGGDALPAPFDPPRRTFSEQPPVNLSGTATGANAAGAAVSASLPAAAPPPNRHAGRPAVAHDGHPIRVAARPEVRPG